MYKDISREVTTLWQTTFDLLSSLFKRSCFLASGGGEHLYYKHSPSISLNTFLSLVALFWESPVPCKEKYNSVRKHISVITAENRRSRIGAAREARKQTKYRVAARSTKQYITQNRSSEKLKIFKNPVPKDWF